MYQSLWLICWYYQTFCKYYWYFFFIFKDHTSTDPFDLFMIIILLPSYIFFKDNISTHNDLFLLWDYTTCILFFYHHIRQRCISRFYHHVWSFLPLGSLHKPCKKTRRWVPLGLWPLHSFSRVTTYRLLVGHWINKYTTHDITPAQYYLDNFFALSRHLVISRIVRLFISTTPFSCDA